MKHTFEFYKNHFDSEYKKRTSVDSKNIFLNESIERAERSLKSQEKLPAKIQDIERINDTGKYLEYLYRFKEEQTPAGKQTKPYRKIRWNGTQKNLAELFLELEKKGWMEKIAKGERAKVCESIEAIFDFSATKKNNETNSLKSFIEIMTPFFDNRNRETSYPKVFTARYKKQFEDIKIAKKTT